VKLTHDVAGPNFRAVAQLDGDTDPPHGTSQQAASVGGELLDPIETTEKCIELIDEDG
jgi:hypothetical protein